MKPRWGYSLVISFVTLLVMVFPAYADGIIIPEPCPINQKCPQPIPPLPHPISQLRIKYHHVTVTVQDQVATTHVDQVFVNPNSWAVEGTYLFPLPVDAAVSNFVLWMDGQPVEGKILDAEQARQTYEEIVRSQRDPALLEYVGRGAVQAKIFPIPSNSERRIELEYSQILIAENGLIHYKYPLNTEKFSTDPLEDVSVTVDVKTNQPIRAVYSPSHAIDVNHVSETHFIAKYQEQNITPRINFDLFYSVGESEAFHLVSYRDPGDPRDQDGYFLMLLAPKPGNDVVKVSKDILLVLDHSGSMDGEKFKQAQSAASYILRHLNVGDRFGIIAFNDHVQSFSSELKDGNEFQSAVDWVNQLSASGSTDINRALLEAGNILKKDDRPTYIIFMTDGLPTQGVVNSDEILRNISSGIPENTRVFSFGVGYDVDTYLLDSISQEHHGISNYVKPGEALDEILSGFYNRISSPVMTNLQVSFGNITTYDLYPDPLPDLFEGNQIVVLGRYKEGGPGQIRLDGTINGVSRTLTYSDQIFVNDSRTDPSAISGIPRIWATRKIGNLLNEIRLKGPNPELVNQIVQLSIRFGIVTPYTSYLVTEPMPLGVDNQKKLSDDAYKQMIQGPAAPSTGQGAVDKAANEGSISRADQAPGMSNSTGEKVAIIGNRTFVLTDGVWVDTAYDPNTMMTQKISFLSKDYFLLSQSRRDAAASLALGERVILVLDQTAYEIVSQDTPVQPVQIPAIIPTQIVITPPSGMHPTDPPPVQTPSITTNRVVDSSPWIMLILSAGVLSVAGALFWKSKAR